MKSEQPRRETRAFMVGYYKESLTSNVEVNVTLKPLMMAVLQPKHMQG
jgi:hypothetical protein